MSVLTDNLHADEVFWLKMVLDSCAKKLTQSVRGIVVVRSFDSTFRSNWRRLPYGKVPKQQMLAN